MGPNEPRVTWFRLILLGFFFSFTASPASGQSSVDDVDPTPLQLLVYHPTPDPQGDPWGVPALQVNGTDVDWMAGYYGGYVFPTLLVDGRLRFEGPPQGETGPYNETYRNYRRAFEDERQRAAPLTIVLTVALADDLLVANATLVRNGIGSETGLSVRAVLFEDDVRYNGGNGIVNHRFVVRALAPFRPLEFGGDATRTERFAFPIPASVDSEHVGITVIAQNTEPDATQFEDQEVVQAATWRAGMGSVRQASKGVLLELYSATWCAACIYGDTASDQLANEFGLASTSVYDLRFSYLRPGRWTEVGFAALMGGLIVYAVVWAKPRRPKEAGPNGQP